MAIKPTCGNILPSGCVPFTGDALTSLPAGQELDCDAGVNDVIKALDLAIKALQNASDISTLTNGSVTLPTPKTLVGSLQVIGDKVSLLSTGLSALQTAVESQLIANELVTIDLKCLAAAAAPCQVSTNTYTLIAVLNALVAEVCAIKTNLAI